MAEAALRGLGSRQRSRRLFAAGMILVGGLGIVAAAAPWLTAYDPDAIVVPHYAGPLPPGGAHPLGTDTLGRDVWARLAYGARTSLFVGGLAMTLSLGIGVTVGLVGGYFGGAVDTALMWLVDLVLTMPTLLLLIVLATVLPPSLLTIPLVIGVVGWTTFARTVRGEVLSLRERDYLLAARALGASHARIIVRHLLPGVLPGVVVLTLDPAIGYDTGSWAFEQMLFNTLVDYDDGTNIVPELAESWQVSPDGRRFAFTLRHGVHFSSGRVLAAGDVKYSLERLLRPALHSPGAEFFAGLDGVDDYVAGRVTEVRGITTPASDRVEFVLAAVDPLFLHQPAMPFASVVDPHAVERAGDLGFRRQPVGTGAFTLAEWVAGQGMVLARNPLRFRS